MIVSRKRKGKVKASGLNLLSSQNAFLSANHRKVTKMRSTEKRPLKNLLGITIRIQIGNTRQIHNFFNQVSQNLTIDSLLIYVLCKSWEQFQIHNLYKTQKSTKKVLSTFGLMEEIYGSVSYLFSCKENRKARSCSY